MGRLFADRREAGRLLAKQLTKYRDRSDVVVLGIPRGGVPVAFEVARALNVQLDVFLVRKLGLPGYKELAMGAIAAGEIGDIVVVNDDVVRAYNVDPDTMKQVEADERKELERRSRVYRDGRPPVPVAGNVAIVVDDGLAAGASMLAALSALQQLKPSRIVVAVPVAPASTCRQLHREADEVICAKIPERFLAVGQAYRDFRQTSDDEVRKLLAAAAVGTTS